MSQYIDRVVATTLSDEQQAAVYDLFSDTDLKHIDDTYERLCRATTDAQLCNVLADEYNAAVLSADSAPLANFYLYNYLQVQCNTVRQPACDPQQTDLYSRYCSKTFGAANEHEFTFKLNCFLGENENLFHHYKRKLVESRIRKVYRLDHVRLLDAISFWPRLPQKPSTQLIAIRDIRLRETHTIATGRTEYDVKVVLAKDVLRRTKDMWESVKMSLEVPFRHAIITAAEQQPPAGLLLAKHLFDSSPEFEKLTNFEYLNAEKTVRLSVDRVYHYGKKRVRTTDSLSVEFEDPNVRVVDIYKCLGDVLQCKS